MVVEQQKLESSMKTMIKKSLRKNAKPFKETTTKLKKSNALLKEVTVTTKRWPNKIKTLKEPPDSNALSMKKFPRWQSMLRRMKGFLRFYKHKGMILTSSKVVLKKSMVMSLSTLYGENKLMKVYLKLLIFTPYSWVISLIHTIIPKRGKKREEYFFPLPTPLVDD